MALRSGIRFCLSLGFLLSLLLVTSPLMAEDLVSKKPAPPTTTAAEPAASCGECAGSAAGGCEQAAKGDHSACQDKSKGSCCGKACDHEKHKAHGEEHCPMMKDMKTSKSE